MDECRLIVDPPAPGAWNMAVDEALLQSAESGRPTLRFYQWSEPTLSLGYFQKLADRQLHPPSSQSDCVRRVTGGGSILHDRELTYSFTTGIADRWGSNAEKLYRLFHETLAEALRTGWEIQAEPCGDKRAACHQPSGESQPFLCFERRSCLDLLVGEGKVAGSAQRRHKQALLQHGSVLLGTSSAAPELPGLYELAGREVDPGKLAELWRESIQLRLGVRCREETLSPAEITLARQWQSQRFSNNEWLAKR